MRVTIHCTDCSSELTGDSADRFLECDCGRQYMVSVTPVDAPDDPDS